MDTMSHLISPFFLPSIFRYVCTDLFMNYNSALTKVPPPKPPQWDLSVFREGAFSLLSLDMTHKATRLLSSLMALDLQTASYILTNTAAKCIESTDQLGICTVSDNFHLRSKISQTYLFFASRVLFLASVYWQRDGLFIDVSMETGCLFIFLSLCISIA